MGRQRANYRDDDCKLRQTDRTTKSNRDGQGGGEPKLPHPASHAKRLPDQHRPLIGSLAMIGNPSDQGKDEDSSSQTASEEDNYRGQGPLRDNQEPKTQHNND